MTTSRVSTRLRPHTSTVFADTTALAHVHGAVNLGQGVPDSDGPPAMLQIAQAAIAQGANQYPPVRGIPELCAAVGADRAQRYGTAYDPATDIVVTAGASEALAAAVLGLLDPGDEVVVIEPYYDLYAAAIAMGGCIRRTARMVRSGTGFALDVDSLRAAITTRTRMLVLNTPHNPTGTVLSHDDLSAIADVAHERDLLVLADEVYEHLAFDAEHISISTLPGMVDRTIVVSSAAKTYNVTGWKVGWACAPAHLIDGVLAAKQFLSFSGGGPFQAGVAYAIAHEQAWLDQHRNSLARKRARLSSVLGQAGLVVAQGSGTYYVCADIGELSDQDAVTFCLDLPKQAGVAAIPVSVFTDDPEPWRTVVRFAACKSDDTLDEAGRRLLAADELRRAG